MKINTKLRFSPFVHISPALPNTIVIMIAAILPQLVFLGIYKDFKALLVIAMSVLFCKLFVWLPQVLIVACRILMACGRQDLVP